MSVQWMSGYPAYRSAQKVLRFRLNALMMVWLICGMLFFSIPPVTANAQEAKGGDAKNDSGDLTTKATNPLGALIQLQLQNLYFPDSNNSSGYANTAYIQPWSPSNYRPIVIFKAS